MFSEVVTSRFSKDVSFFLIKLSCVIYEDPRLLILITCQEGFIIAGSTEYRDTTIINQEYRGLSPWICVIHVRAVGKVSSQTT